MGKQAKLNLGLDVLVVVLFTAGGMIYHSLTDNVTGDFLRISAPFLVGMLSCYWACGNYQKTENGGAFVKATFWGLSTGLVTSFFLRAILQNSVPIVRFLIPASLFFLVMTLISRSAAWFFFKGN